MTDYSFTDLQNAIEEHGGIRPAGRALGMAESTIRSRLKSGIRQLIGQPEVDEQVVFSQSRLPAPIQHDPDENGTRYFILTAAQDNTDIHEDFWKCLNVYAEWLSDCEILVSGFTYAKKLFEDHDKRSENVHYHPEIDDYIIHNRVNIGEKLVFCGEMNTLPTAVKPLSGFQTYTRNKWGIFPHVKVQLESVPTAKKDIAKQIMTTGAVTMPHYVRKKAGIKAEFDHIIGAVLVALNPDGSFWCRHLQATSETDGSFYDLDRFITAEGVSTDNRVAGITYGDVHHEKLDPDVALATWGYDTQTGTLFADYREELPIPLTQYLRPEYDFFHDLSDFSPRNHHNIKDHHFLLATHVKQTGNVEQALLACGNFLKAVNRDECQSVVIQSNHDNAFVKWLKTAADRVRYDAENYQFYLRSELNYVNYLMAGESNPPVFEDVLRDGGCPDSVLFVGEDDSFKVCGVECAMHGHLGANGAKASPTAFERMGSKSNTGHVHSPGITSGNYRSGVCSLEMGYNKGLSSWAIAHTIIYPNGRRTILTFMNGKFYE